MRILSIAMAMLFACFANSAAVDMNDPNQVMHTISDNTFARMNAEKSRLQSDPLYINVVIEEELLPYFDYKYAAYKVMGRHLQNTTQAQRSEFVDAFKTYLVNVYGHILFEYEQQEVEILDTPLFKDKKIVSIAVRIHNKEQLTKIDFKLRKNTKTGEWKVFDVIAEGISMLHTKESEFGELIQKNGINHVIDLLQQKNRELSS